MGSVYYAGCMKLRYFLILAAILGIFAHDGQAQDVTQAQPSLGRRSAPYCRRQGGLAGRLVDVGTYMVRDGLHGGHGASGGLPGLFQLH